MAKAAHETTENIDYTAQYTMFSTYPDVLGVIEVAEMLGGISFKLVYRLFKENKIVHLRIGREFKTTKEDVIDFINHEKRKMPK
jgi:hypothetical protein